MASSAVMMKPLNRLTSSFMRESFIGSLRKCSDLCKSGKKQSPIDICTPGAEPVEMGPLKFENHFDDKVKLCMAVVGNVLQVKANSDCPLTLEGGPLCEKYNFDQLNFKWGECDTEGSEHSIDKEKLAMEAQLVYFNSQFKCAAEALKEPNGLAMLAVFLKATENKNCDFDAFVSCLQALKTPGQTVPLPTNILPMFQEALSAEYFSYEGSLTVPPCCENVRWMVFKNPVCVHKDQVAAFRNICGPDGKITKNTREIQELNDRKITLAKEKKC